MLASPPAEGESRRAPDGAPDAIAGRVSVYAHVAYTVVLMPEMKSQRVRLRVAASDDELFRSAAAAANESLSEFLVELFRRPRPE